MQKYLEQFGIDLKYIKVKTFFDQIFSLIILIILLPILIFISIIIFLLIKENPFFISYRKGKNNKRFKLYKFKSMRTNKSMKNYSITLSKDKRIYSFGRIIRITKIDELPQLINIIKGDMSFVGPRPEDEMIVDKYFSKEDLKTLTIMPGLVSPGSLFNYLYVDNRLSSKDEYINKYLPLKLKLESLYIKKISFFYDLNLIFKTIFLIFFLKYFRSNPEKIFEFRYVKDKL